MNKLSPRLRVIADYIDDNDKYIIDIGCDHAFLSIYLASKYKNSKIIASDVNSNALNSAITNIKNANLSDRIDVRLGNGLAVINDEKIDTIVMSGLGSNTIVGILKYSLDKLKNVNKIVIQSNTDLYFLRRNITGIGYYIDSEKLVKDKDIIYTVIVFKRGKKRYSYSDLYLGPILKNNIDNLFILKYKKELNTNKMILSNIKKGHYFYKLRIKRNIKIISDILKV